MVAGHREHPVVLDLDRARQACAATIDDSRISSTVVLKYARMLPSLIRFSRSGLIQYLILSDSAAERTISVTSAPCR